MPGGNYGWVEPGYTVQKYCCVMIWTNEGAPLKADNVIIPDDDLNKWSHTAWTISCFTSPLQQEHNLLYLKAVTEPRQSLNVLVPAEIHTARGSCLREKRVFVASFSTLIEFFLAIPNLWSVEDGPFGHRNKLCLYRVHVYNTCRSHKFSSSWLTVQQTPECDNKREFQKSCKYGAKLKADYFRWDNLVSTITNNQW